MNLGTVSSFVTSGMNWVGSVWSNTVEVEDGGEKRATVGGDEVDVGEGIKLFEIEVSSKYPIIEEFVEKAKDSEGVLKALNKFPEFKREGSIFVEDAELREIIQNLNYAPNIIRFLGEYKELLRRGSILLRNENALLKNVLRAGCSRAVLQAISKNIGLWNKDVSFVDERISKMIFGRNDASRIVTIMFEGYFPEYLNKESRIYIEGIFKELVKEEMKYDLRKALEVFRRYPRLLGGRCRIIENGGELFRQILKLSESDKILEIVGNNEKLLELPNFSRVIKDKDCIERMEGISKMIEECKFFSKKDYSDLWVKGGFMEKLADEEYIWTAIEGIKMCYQVEELKKLFFTGQNSIYKSAGRYMEPDVCTSVYCMFNEDYTSLKGRSHKELKKKLEGVEACRKVREIVNEYCKSVKESVK